MPGILTGQVALVTDAGRGIGREISLALGTAGAYVITAVRSQPEMVHGLYSHTKTQQDHLVPC